jgi:uncharacterized membrane protein
MAVALIVIATHDLFDGLKPADFHFGQVAAVHAASLRRSCKSAACTVFVLFPLIPWCAVTLLGFSMGFLFEGNSASGRRTLWLDGQARGRWRFSPALRFTNIYGNPSAGLRTPRLATGIRCRHCRRPLFCFSM